MRTLQMFSIHAKQERKFINGVFSLKTHQIFSIHTSLEKFEITVINGHFKWICVRLRKTRTARNYMISKSFVFKMFSVLTETKTGVFEFLQFEERFSKAMFRDG